MRGVFFGDFLRFGTVDRFLGMNTVCLASPAPVSSWRFSPEHTTRVTMAVAMILSAAIHAEIFWGFGRSTAQPRIITKEKLVPLMFTTPSLKDLEEPPPAADNKEKPPPDPATLAPKAPDVPAIPNPRDFSQPIDYASLLPAPDYSKAKLYTIPANIGTGTRPGDGGKIFDPADLDRRPEAVYQPAPIFPADLKRDVEHATVVVEFIVAPDGRVTNAFVRESTHAGFDKAATAGVMKWRFRAGLKSGRLVNTRMLVPIVFTLTGGGP